ncbi:kinase-like domain-containing protein, partial [Mycena floridula]
IIAQIQVILQDKETYRTFVSQTGDEARNLLSLLHELIDWPELPTRIRAEFTAALVRLSKKSGCYPDLFGLSGLIRSGSHAVVAGGFGDIWQGLLKGRKVSVKVARVFLDGDVQQFVKAFYTEAILWGQLSHPNVLPLYGIYYLDSEDRSQLCLVSPWMENGNIVEFLRKAPAGSVKHHSLISDIACGMEYLHKSSIVHGDLKGLNILITPSHRACLMDFGLASVANSAIPNWTSLSVQQGGTWRWQAPEILQAQPNSFKGDVYAFGCVCYQVRQLTLIWVYTGRVPFHDISNDMAVSLKVINGHRPSRPAELPESDDNIWKLIEDCWKADPGERPIAAQVVQRLSGPGNTPSLTNTDSEWDESFPRDLRRSLRHQKIVPSDKELADLLPKQQPG